VLVRRQVQLVKERLFRHRHQFMGFADWHSDGVDSLVYNYIAITGDEYEKARIRRLLAHLSQTCVRLMQTSMKSPAQFHETWEDLALHDRARCSISVLAPFQKGPSGFGVRLPCILLQLQQGPSYSGVPPPMLLSLFLRRKPINMDDGLILCQNL